MRFTRASEAHGIPKGTLYDHVLGKTGRMKALGLVPMSKEEAKRLVDFCKASPSRMEEVMDFVNAKRQKDHLTQIEWFRWWWAFCKKHSLVYYHKTDANNNFRKDRHLVPPPAHSSSSTARTVLDKNAEPQDLSLGDLNASSEAKTAIP